MESYSLISEAETKLAEYKPWPKSKGGEFQSKWDEALAIMSGLQYNKKTPSVLTVLFLPQLETSVMWKTLCENGNPINSNNKGYHFSNIYQRGIQII